MNKISGHGLKRIQGYDLARGVAIFAMVIIDFKAFFCTDETYPEWLYAIIEYMDRRAAVLLVMIAGAGMTLMSRRADLEKSEYTLFKRAVFLMLCGIPITTIWPADILHFYGFFILTGLVMVQLSSRGLLVGAAVFWLISFIGLFDTAFGHLENFAAGSLPKQLAEFFFTGYYPVFPWAALYLFGMWLGRQDLKNRHVAITLLGSGLLAAVLSECAGSFIPGMAGKIIIARGASDETAAYIFILLSKLTVMDLTIPSPVSIISSAGTGLCVIILSFMCACGLKQGPPQSFLIAGKNTLSFYVLHILCIKGIETLPGIGEDYPVLWCTAGAIFFNATYVLLMRLWLKKFAMGPLEAAMRHFPFVKTDPLVKAHHGAGTGEPNGYQPK